MGLAVLVGANNFAELEAGADDSQGFDLSQHFCDLLGQRHMEDIEAPLLDQVGAIADVDISPLNEMIDYLSPDDVASLLRYDRDEEARAKTRLAGEDAQAAVAQNLPRVRATLATLLEHLVLVPDLFHRLVPDDYGMFDYEAYFSDFQLDTSAETGDQNFGEDLRNLKRFLDYAHSKGTHTVFFAFG
jgi:hypothetical protein